MFNEKREDLRKYDGKKLDAWYTHFTLFFSMYSRIHKNIFINRAIGCILYEALLLKSAFSDEDDIIENKPEGLELLGSFNELCTGYFIEA